MAMDSLNAHRPGVAPSYGMSVAHSILSPMVRCPLPLALSFFVLRRTPSSHARLCPVGCGRRGGSGQLQPHPQRWEPVRHVGEPADRNPCVPELGLRNNRIVTASLLSYSADSPCVLQP
eukprot:1680997-Rhodomonas_salina.2